MKNAIRRLLWVALMLLMPAGANATITCFNFTAPAAYNLYYASGTSALNSTIQQNLSVTCTRDSFSDPTTINATIAPVNVHSPASITVAGTTHTIDYGYFYQGCSVAFPVVTHTLGGWTATPQTLTFSTTLIYNVCILGTPVYPTAEGIFTATDTFRMTFNSPVLPALTAAPTQVNIHVLGACGITAVPGNIVLNYPSYSGSDVTASTTFGLRCNTNYSMDLSPTGGTMEGVDYTLAITPAGTSGVGQLQTYNITGKAIQGQVGTCGGSCTSTTPHTLTVTY